MKSLPHRHEVEPWGQHDMEIGRFGRFGRLEIPPSEASVIGLSEAAELRGKEPKLCQIIPTAR